MAKPVSIPNSFATSTAAIPLSYLDQDFNALANSTNDLATYSNYVADTGAANAYIANFPTNTNTSSLTAGLRVQFKAANANSGASTLNVQVNSVSIGSGSIVLTDGTALPANAIVANAVVDVIYDGSNFQIVNDASGAAETISNLTVTNDATIGGNLTVDTSTLYVDATNNRVGIGNTTPDAVLKVNSDASGTDFRSLSTKAGIALNFNGTGISYYDSDNTVFRKSSSGGSTELMRITSSGNVGIGTSSPSVPLDIATTTASPVRQTIYGAAPAYSSRRANGTSSSPTAITSGQTIFQINGSGYGATAFSSAINRAYIWGHASENWTDSAQGTYLSFGTTSSNSTTNAERMRIDSSGNVGIGTSSPSSDGPLSIQRDGAGACELNISLINGVSNKECIVNFGNNLATADRYKGRIFYQTDNNIMGFWTNASERMRIDSSGNVGIGTSSPSVKLDVVTTAADDGGQITGGATGANLYLKNTGTGGRTYRIYSTGSSSASGAGFLGFYDETASAFRMGITSGGEVYIAGTTDRGAYNLQCNGTGVWGAGAYVNGSDERIKENITSLDSGLDVIAKLNPVTYKYKKDWSKDQSTQTGFIAQELLVALEGKNYADGIVQQGGEYMSVAYQNIIPLLTKAIQEQQDIIKALETRIQTLENK